MPTSVSEKPAPAVPAFRWSRNIHMISLSFFRIDTSYSLENGLRVEFQTKLMTDKIEVAVNCIEKNDDGYIGKGATKHGIYVSNYHFRLVADQFVC